jgi:hypothetical protein
MPERIQRKRTKGWRMPEGAVYVGRPGKWGNPFKVGAGYVTRGVIDSPSPINGPYVEGTYKCRGIEGKTVSYEARTVQDAAEAVDLFRAYITGSWFWDKQSLARELGGRDLACWCPLEQPCHADVLLELANGGEVRG